MARKKVAAKSKSMSLEDLVDLRERTGKVGKSLEDQLSEYLKTLWPLFAPKRILGSYMSPRDDVKGSDATFADLCKRFNSVRAEPFGLMGELEKSGLAAASGGFALYPWQYVRAVPDGKEIKAVKITSPTCWVLTYRSDYSLAQMTQAVEDSGDPWPSPTRDFVVGSLVMTMMMERHPGVVSLIEDLRYSVEIKKSAKLGKLPLVTLRARIDATLPPDDILLKAIRFSGVSAFHELVAADSVEMIEDPVKQRLTEILA